MKIINILVLGILFLGSSAFAKKPGKPDFFIFDSPTHAGSVVINEINNNENYIELYFNEGVNITHWTLITEGQGNKGDYEIDICNASWASYPNKEGCGFFSKGTFLVISNIELHNTLQEILLIDQPSITSNEGKVLVHYLHYTNNLNSGKPVYDSKIDSDNKTIYENPGNESVICTKPDGELGNWSECDGTEGESNLTAKHFLIEHDGSGLTCSAEGVIIKACKDSSCGEILSAADGYLGQEVILNTGTEASQVVQIEASGESEGASFYSTANVRLSLAVEEDERYLCKNNLNSSTINSESACDISFNDSDGLYSCEVDKNELCKAFFTTGVVSQNNINILYNAQVLQGEFGEILNSPVVSSELSSSKKSCGDSHCIASHSERTPYDVGGVKTTISEIEVCADKKNGWDCGYKFPDNAVTLIGTEYKHINVTQDAIVNMGNGESTVKEYYIKKLTLGYLSTINLSPGNYWVEELNITSGNRIDINTIGQGDVQIFINNTVSFPDKTHINQSGNANMLVYGFQGLNFRNKSSINAFVYSKGDLTLNYQATVTGALSGQNVTLQNDSIVNYSCDYEPPEEPEPSICEAPFIDGATSFATSGNDNIKLESGAKIINNPDTELASFSVSSHKKSYCQTASGSLEKCNASGQPVDEITLPDFKFVPNEFSFFPYVSWLAVYPNVLGKPVSYIPYWSRIDVDDNEHVTFTINDEGEYRIETLNLGENVTLNLAPGDYWINNLNTTSSSTGFSGDADNLTINVIGEGTVNFYVRTSSASEYSNLLVEIMQNSKINSSSDDSVSEPAINFRIYAWGKFHIKSDAEINAYIYSQENIEIENGSVLTGAASSNNVTLKKNSTIDFTCSATTQPISKQFLIEHDGSGLTCAAEEILIKACLDDECTSFDTSFDTTTVKLTYASKTKEITIGSNGQSDDAYYNHTEPGTITLGIEGLTPVCKNTRTGNKNSDGACESIFSDSGFLINVSDDMSCGAESVFIQAVKKSDDSQQCEAALSGSRDVLLNLNYATPSTGTKSATFSHNGAQTLSTSQETFNLTFDDTSTAILNNFSYPDAGTITITATHKVTNGDLEHLHLEGQGTATIYPATFMISAINDNGSALDGSGLDDSSFIHKSGEDFTLNVAAQCVNGTSNPNFKPKNDESLKVSVQRVAPDDDGFDGELNAFGLTFLSSLLSTESTNLPENWLNIPMDKVDQGIIYKNTESKSKAANYSEVGIIKVFAQYEHSKDVVITAASENIGRFTPAYLTQSIDTAGQLTSGCGAFAYIGQEDLVNPDLTVHNGMLFGPAPEINIMAYNAHGELTQNYFDVYRKLSKNTVYSNVDFSGEDETAQGVDNTKLSITANVNEGDFSEIDDAKPTGKFKYIFNVDDRFVYDRSLNSQVAPFVSDILIKLNQFEDSDGILVNDDSYLSLHKISDDPLEIRPTGIDILFARMQLKDSFGIEGQRLTQNLEVEVFNGAGFERHLLNTCTPFNSDNYTINNATLDKDDYLIDGVVGTESFLNGEQSSSGLMPISNNNTGSGSLLINYDAPTWFNYDWGSGDLIDPPSATATYGIFNRPSKRIISEQEVFQ